MITAICLELLGPEVVSMTCLFNKKAGRQARLRLLSLRPKGRRLRTGEGNANLPWGRPWQGQRLAAWTPAGPPPSQAALSGVPAEAPTPTPPRLITSSPAATYHTKQDHRVDCAGLSQGGVSPQPRPRTQRQQERERDVEGKANLEGHSRSFTTGKRLQMSLVIIVLFALRQLWMDADMHHTNCSARYGGVGETHTNPAGLHARCECFRPSGERHLS